jgi:aspartate carbamoyltransferase regulatory subunit
MIMITSPSKKGTFRQGSKSLVSNAKRGHSSKFEKAKKQKPFSTFIHCHHCEMMMMAGIGVSRIVVGWVSQ